MNLVLGSITATEADIVVRIRRSIVQIRAERTRIRPIVPIATTFHSAPLITIQPIPIQNKNSHFHSVSQSPKSHGL